MAKKQCLLSQERFSLTLDCLSLGRSQWAYTSLTNGFSEGAGGPWGPVGSAWEVYTESLTELCQGTQLLWESNLLCYVPGCPPPLLGSAWEYLGTLEYRPTQWDSSPLLPHGWGVSVALSWVRVDSEAVQNLSGKLQLEPCASENQVETLILRLSRPLLSLCTQTDITPAYKPQSVRFQLAPSPHPKLATPWGMVCLAATAKWKCSISLGLQINHSAAGYTFLFSIPERVWGGIFFFAFFINKYFNWKFPSIWQA